MSSEITIVNVPIEQIGLLPELNDSRTHSVYFRDEKALGAFVMTFFHGKWNPTLGVVQGIPVDNLNEIRKIGKKKPDFAKKMQEFRLAEIERLSNGSLESAVCSIDGGKKGNEDATKARKVTVSAVEFANECRATWMDDDGNAVPVLYAANSANRRLTTVMWVRALCRKLGLPMMYDTVPVLISEFDSEDERREANVIENQHKDKHAQKMTKVDIAWQWLQDVRKNRGGKELEDKFNVKHGIGQKYQNLADCINCDAFVKAKLFDVLLNSRDDNGNPNGDTLIAGYNAMKLRELFKGEVVGDPKDKKRQADVDPEFVPDIEAAKAYLANPKAGGNQKKIATRAAIEKFRKNTGILVFKDLLDCILEADFTPLEGLVPYTDALNKAYDEITG